MAKKRCFVIMPFSKTKEHHAEEYWTRHFNSYLKQLIEKNGDVEAFRSDPLKGNIANQIITDLANTDIVVADLTDHNPNVLWELGVRQSFKHCNITIAEVGTEVPFDLNHKAILFYNGDHLDNQAFEQKFLLALKKCADHPDDPDSPVIEALGGKGTLYNILHREENKRKLESLIMEFLFNKSIHSKVQQCCEENKSLRAQGKKDDELSMVSVGLASMAAENLYINRYLELEDSFYDNLLVYCRNVEAMNTQLQKWSERSNYAENFLRNNQEKFLSNFQQVYDVLTKTLADHK